MSSNATLTIGKNGGFSGVSIVCASKISIGENVGMGVNVNIWDTDFHSIQHTIRSKQTNIAQALSKEIQIGNNVWIGANSTILKGSELGNNTVVSTFSLVNKIFASNLLIGGVPARKLKDI